MDFFLAHLSEILEYDGGLLRWKVRRGAIKAGRIAGCRRAADGYVSVRAYGHQHQAHRLIWMLHHGNIQENMEIDHINGIRHDNRIENLRCVTRSLNMQNLRRANKDSKSGMLGVVEYRPGKFHAEIRHGGKIVYLGSFDNAIDAYDTYIKAKRKLHPGCTI